MGNRTGGHMEVNCNGHQRLRFRVLLNEQIEKIYQAALHYLNQTGVNVLNSEGMELLTEADTRMDGVRVYILSTW